MGMSRCVAADSAAPGKNADSRKRRSSRNAPHLTACSSGLCSADNTCLDVFLPLSAKPAVLSTLQELKQPGLGIEIQLCNFIQDRVPRRPGPLVLPYSRTHP